MKNLYELKEIQALIACFLVSVCASFARVLLFKQDDFKTTLKTFVGGIFFGTVVGYLVGRSAKYASWDTLCSAWSSLIGKEFVNFLVVEAPAMLRGIWDKIKNLKFGSK